MRAMALTVSLVITLAACGQPHPNVARPPASAAASSPRGAGSPPSATTPRVATPPRLSSPPRLVPPRVATPPRGALPTPAPGLLFAVVEANGAGSFLNAGIGDAPDTVAIVGLDGVARAKATFPPRSSVFVGNAAPIQGPVARTAAGAVFYADGRGVLRRLDVDGKVSTVATFPLTDPQQQLRFAVRPDGGTVLATTISFPAKHDPPPQDPSQPAFMDGAHWLVALDRSDAGRVTRIYSRDLGDQFPRDVPTVAGWIDSGPLVGSAELGTQQPPLELIGAAGLHVADLGGQPGRPVGGDQCVAQSFTRAGVVLCMSVGFESAQVRSAGGDPEWDLPTDCVWPTSPIQLMWALSPAGTRVASFVNVCSRDGTVIRLPAGFHPEGWLDENTLIGTVGDLSGNELGLVRLSDPTAAEDLGFKGEFVGVVSG